MASSFPARKVRITRVYLVDCDDCDAVTPDLSACITRKEAERARQEHIDWHRSAIGMPVIGSAR